MFEMPETYQVGVTSWFRGPERRPPSAREGDLQALEEVAALPGTLTGVGANSLIIPVRSNGVDVARDEATLIRVPSR